MLSQIVCKSYNKKLLNRELAGAKNSLSVTNVVSGIHLIDKDMVTKLVSEMRNGKAASSSSSLMLELVKPEDKAVDMITDLIKQITEERVIPAEWKLITIEKVGHT